MVALEVDCAVSALQKRSGYLSIVLVHNHSTTRFDRAFIVARRQVLTKAKSVLGVNQSCKQYISNHEEYRVTFIRAFKCMKVHAYNVYDIAVAYKHKQLLLR
jgi:hypothetical protein